MMAVFNIFLWKCNLQHEGKLPLQYGHHAIYVKSGNVVIDGAAFAAGEGFYGQENDVIFSQSSRQVNILCFTVSKQNAPLLPDDGKMLLSDHFEWQQGAAVMRLDKVTFPPGAIAYRHFHAGPGIRYLVKGELEIKSDHNTEYMVEGDAWFEDANSPVQATAGEHRFSGFVRAMVLPIDFQGKPTIQLLNPEDIAKPSLQTNHRYIDQRIEL
jgi:quercetin dioxygenase-like cupin family protein